MSVDVIHDLQAVVADLKRRIEALEIAVVVKVKKEEAQWTKPTPKSP